MIKLNAKTVPPTHNIEELSYLNKKRIHYLNLLRNLVSTLTSILKNKYFKRMRHKKLAHDDF
jgi:hypothetical protein